MDDGHACQDRAACEEAEDCAGETVDEPAAVVAVLGVADGSGTYSDCAAGYGAYGHPARRIGEVRGAAEANDAADLISIEVALPVGLRGIVVGGVDAQTRVAYLV